MTQSSPDVPPQRPHHEHEPAAAEMPRWVPVAIGVVLVTLAALAVITGMRYRDQTLVKMMQPRTQPRGNAPAPPGEPEPGASLMFPGDAGANIPEANAPVEGSARAEVSGGPGGVNAVVRIWARRGMRVNVTPADAVIYVNNVAIGQAAQFDSETEEYDFAAPGSYTVRLIAPGYRERQYIVTVADNAKQETAHIEASLEKQ
jgi:hypothetical protein